MQLLIADDDPLSTAALKRTLAETYDVVVAHDGASALEALRQPNAPSLAILDWMMPHLNGPDVCRLIRADAGDAVQRHRYLILLTSRDGHEDVVAGLQAGANDYLVKPFHRGELLARLSVGVRVLELQDGLAARVADLEAALSQVKQLSGLLPICSYCKSIRSDDHYWQQVEGYLAAHSNAQFTHAICPTCYDGASKELDEYARSKERHRRLAL
jgi:phosphoserine phosphatase RsbU/P